MPPQNLATFVFGFCVSAAMAAATTPAERLINKLYEDFGSAGPNAGERKPLVEQSPAALGKYFVPSLATLLVKDHQCVVRTQEICNLDFDPLYASQDPDAADLSIRAAAADKVVVSFRYPSNGERITIRYLLAPTHDGLRITDVVYSDQTSLRKLLTSKLP